jgi:AcrR family transcriptional regulator
MYRYFSNRHALLTALHDYSVEEALRAIEAADLPNASVVEGIARLSRAFVGLHSKYAVLVQMGEQFRDDAVARQLSEPIEAVLRRGVEGGIVTDEFTETELIYMFGGLVRAAAELEASGQVTLERAARLASNTFLSGIAPF